jgi:hypothetical protein
MKSVKQICLWVAFALLLVGCSVPAIASTNPIIAAATLPAVMSSPSVPTEAPAQNPTRANATDPIPTANLLPTPTRPNPTDPAPTASAVATCPSTAEGQRGLYVISLDPLPSLVWNQTPRQFRVGVCNTLAESIVPESRFRVSVFAPATKNPLGQTSELSAQLAPGLHELVLGSWTPGLQNHVTACAVWPTVEILVEYNDFPAANSFRPVLWPDGSERKSFSVACGGTFP